MNKVGSLLLTGAILPLFVCAAEELDKVIVIEKNNQKKSYKIESFYKGYSRTLITKEDISEASANNVQDLLKNISNVTVKDKGSFSKSLQIRGFSGNRITSIVDGAKLSNQGITMGGGGELGLVESSSVEQIEVIKGSPSVIYDPGATGGVIKVTTIKDTTAMKDQVKLKHTYLYDDGYALNKNATLLETKYKDLYFSVSGAITDSKERKMKDKDKLAEVLHETNIRDERYGTPYELKDLGFESNAYGLLAKYAIIDNVDLFYKLYDLDAKDITATYGSRRPMAFRYDKFQRDGEVLGIKAKDLGGFNHIDLLYHKQKLYRRSYGQGRVKNELNLQSNTKKIDLEFPAFEHTLIHTGLERTKDKAKTLTYSEQIYNAMYLNIEYIYNNFTLSTGTRANSYNVQQHIKPGQNLDTIEDLAGVSGVLKDDINDDKLNYSFGLTYSLTDFQNFAFNFSTTYQYPSLYERFAFGGGFIGGGENMKAEEAKNYELSWKFLEDDFSCEVALFQSDFDSYNDTYVHYKVKNETALKECNKDPDCNPFDGLYNEDRIYDTWNKYASFENVKRRGFELDIRKRFQRQNLETSFQIAQTRISDSLLRFQDSNATLESEFLQEPLEMSASIKKEFEHYLKPWVKLKLRHVTNSPTVNQRNGYNTFSKGDLYFGLTYKNIVFNGGVRNLSDAVYHEPYSPIDGVQRSMFMNVSLELDKLL